jgi:CRISPR type III-A-associated protein Csm2
MKNDQMRRALEDKGFKESNPSSNPKSGKHDGRRRNDKKIYWRLSEDYLKDGYFDQNNCLWQELITDRADEIAKGLSYSRPELKNHQMRRFYSHIRKAKAKLDATGNWNCVKIDVLSLQSFIAEAKAKKKVPEAFYDFMVRNLEATKNEQDFVKGFLPHFQAVVGFYAFHKPRD